MEHQRPVPNHHPRDITNARGAYEGVTIDLSTVPRLQIPIQLNPRQFYFTEIPLPNLPAVNLHQHAVEVRETSQDRYNTNTDNYS